MIEAAEELSCLRPRRAIPDKVVETAIAEEPRLNEGQIAAVRTVCRGRVGSP